MNLHAVDCGCQKITLTTDVHGFAKSLNFDFYALYHIEFISSKILFFVLFVPFGGNHHAVNRITILQRESDGNAWNKIISLI